MGDKTKVQQLLAVLDMNEDEQYYWLCHHYAKYHCKISVFPDNNKEKRRELADLAFRLRDEVLGKEKFWYGNLHVVYCYAKNMNVNYDITPGRLSQYFLFEANPIHWIIAAFIAKENINGGLQKESEEIESG